MTHMTDGVDPRTGQAIRKERSDWTTHPNNPMRKKA
jgi:dihydropyrimidine dehydrogenase (NAD+) subunit PreA